MGLAVLRDGEDDLTGYDPVDHQQTLQPYQESWKLPYRANAYRLAKVLDLADDVQQEMSRLRRQPR